MKKLFGIFAIILIAALVFFHFRTEVEASDSGALFPSTSVSDATVGVNAWGAPENATADDANITSCLTHTSTASGNIDDIVRLVVGGTISGNDLSDGQNFSTAGNKTFGGATELWGLTPTYANINASDFGVVISVRNTNGGVNTPTQYLKTTNFGFTIPTNATIDGISVLYDVATAASGQVRIDSVRITVYYTEAATSNTTTLKGNVTIKAATIR